MPCNLIELELKTGLKKDRGWGCYGGKVHGFMVSELMHAKLVNSCLKMALK